MGPLENVGTLSATFRRSILHAHTLMSLSQTIPIHADRPESLCGRGGKQQTHPGKK